MFANYLSSREHETDVCNCSGTWDGGDGAVGASCKFRAGTIWPGYEITRNRRLARYIYEIKARYIPAIKAGTHSLDILEFTTVIPGGSRAWLFYTYTASSGMSISASLLIFPPPSSFSRRITRSSSKSELRAPNLSNFSRDPATEAALSRDGIEHLASRFEPLAVGFFMYFHRYFQIYSKYKNYFYLEYVCVEQSWTHTLGIVDINNVLSCTCT